MSRPFSLLIALTFIFSISLHAEENSDPISFGDVEIGENRLPLSVEDFYVSLDLPKNIKAKVILKKKTIEWVRVKNVLLLPRARMSFYIKSLAEHIHLRYKGHSINLQQLKNFSYTEFYVSLFQHEPIEIYQLDRKIGSIRFYARTPKKGRRSVLIDYSCSRYGITLENLDNEFVSVGCRTKRIGSFGSEVPMVELFWATANFRLMDRSASPYLAVLQGNKKIKAVVMNPFGTKRVITIHAKIPDHINRFGTAIGLGPYTFDTSYQDDWESEHPGPEEKYSAPTAPALMLYFNLWLNETTSIRGFDALVFKKSVFNNAGFYLANDVAKILDNKLTITTLIGMQALYFKFDNSTNPINEPIFPQGIEFNLKHPFGNINHIFGGGMFLSPSDSVKYQNVWLRYNSWELNYIYWGQQGFSAKMWGLSYIIPFVRLF